MKPVSLLIAGAANPHVRNYYSQLMKMPEIEVLGVADTDLDRRLWAREAFRDYRREVALFEDWHQLLDAFPNAEAVMVGTDNAYHYEVMMEVIRRRKHIYSMKVISMDEAQAEEVTTECHRQGLVMQVELELHFAPQYRQMREALRAGKLGELVSIYITNVSQCPCPYFPNWCDPFLSYGARVPLKPGSRLFRGGALTDHPHPFDLCHWLTGREIVSLQAVSSRNQREWIEVEDHIAIMGELEGGAKFFINPSYSNLEENVPTRRLYWPKSLEVNVKITGTQGYLAADYFDKPVFVVGSNYVSPNRLIVDGAPKVGGAYQGLLYSFINAVRGKGEVETGGKDGLRAIRAMNAAYEAVASGGKIRLR